MEESVNKVEEEIGTVLEQAKELQESVASLLSRTNNDEQSLRQKALSLESSIRSLRSLIDSLVSRKLLDPKLADKASACSFFRFSLFLNFLVTPEFLI